MDYLRVCFLCCYVCLFPNMVNATPERVTLENLKWADQYLREHIIDLSLIPLKSFPKILIVKFPKEWNDDARFAAIVVKWDKQLEPVIAKGTKIPPEGIILLRDDVDWTSTKWRGIVIHEMCHYRDFYTDRGCSCDPYTIQQYFYYIEGESSNIGEWTDWNKHDPSRVCDIKVR